jgi:hypothetical protein
VYIIAAKNILLYSEEEICMNKIEKVRTFITALQSGDAEVAANCMADQFTFAGWLHQPLSKNEFLGVQSRLLDAMPDFTYNLSDEREVGDTVEAWTQIMGTQIHDLLLPTLDVPFIQATGNGISLPQTRTTFTFDKEKIAQMMVETILGGGLAGILQQLGRELPLEARIRDFGQMAELPVDQEIEEHQVAPPWEDETTELDPNIEQPPVSRAGE